MVAGELTFYVFMVDGWRILKEQFHSSVASFYVHIRIFFSFCLPQLPSWFIHFISLGPFSLLVPCPLFVLFCIIISLDLFFFFSIVPYFSYSSAHTILSSGIPAHCRPLFTPVWKLKKKLYFWGILIFFIKLINLAQKTAEDGNGGSSKQFRDIFILKIDLSGHKLIRKNIFFSFYVS